MKCRRFNAYIWEIQIINASIKFNHSTNIFITYTNKLIFDKGHYYHKITDISQVFIEALIVEWKFRIAGNTMLLKAKQIITYMFHSKPLQYSPPLRWLIIDRSANYYF